MEHARIAELLQPYVELSRERIDLISIYVDILLKWNARTNLTAVRDAEQIIQRHFGESLFAARHLLDPQSAASIIDVGSGAGFPGMVLKIFAPSIALTLIESQNKKATFLKEVARQLGIGVQVLNTRAETLDLRAELVTLRAVEKFESVVPVASRLVAPGGRLALLIGSAQFESARRLCPGTWQDPIAIPQSSSRILAVVHL